MFEIYLTLSFPPSIVNASVSAFILFALAGSKSIGGELVETVTVISPV